MPSSGPLVGRNQPELNSFKGQNCTESTVLYREHCTVQRSLIQDLTHSTCPPWAASMRAVAPSSALALIPSLSPSRMTWKKMEEWIIILFISSYHLLFFLVPRLCLCVEYANYCKIRPDFVSR